MLDITLWLCLFGWFLGFVLCFFLVVRISTSQAHWMGRKGGRYSVFLSLFYTWSFPVYFSFSFFPFEKETKAKSRISHSYSFMYIMDLFLADHTVLLINSLRSCTRTFPVRPSLSVVVLSYFFTFSSLTSPHPTCTMDLSDSPFSDLDVYADWSGDPSEPVEVKIEVEVTSPKLRIPSN